VYARRNGKDAVLVILNPSAAACVADFTTEIPHSKLTLLAGKKVKLTRNKGGLSVTVPGQTYAVYKMR
jgi:hypothetical protein